ncbi:MAG: pyridoxal-dependent decarboxylase [Robiginitalea sp.]|uniref:pyridoxal phosphate-dependent decarboxylase family protein n=1 Tax=Robiginitalea sp. TaxID=1902411 RepID=UPI003C725CDF
MEEDLLHQAYDPETFRKEGQQLINQLSEYLKETLSGYGPVLNYSDPKEQLELWKKDVSESGSGVDTANILKHITRVHHPRYMGHQVAPPLPVASLMALLGGFLNNGMAVYEMGMAPTAMEHLITGWLCRKVGYSSSARGILTSGGTLANLTALLSARRNGVAEDIWNRGYSGGLAILVSEAAHYCVDRAARIMGLGEAGVLKVPVLENFSMDTSKLPGIYEAARQKGLTPFAIVGSAPCTATGSYDHLEALADFAEENDLWFHVDGAHGGPAVLSEKYKFLVQGIQRADSVVIDGHKMMGMPVITTALLFSDGATSYNTFSQEAEYLLADTVEEDWSNGAKRTFECTKLTSSLTWYAVLKQYGEPIFEAFLNRQYDLARSFSDLIRERPNWELACEPQSNILCFRWAPLGIPSEGLDEINENIRKKALEEGRFYIVQTRLKGTLYLRTSLMNPFTGTAHLSELLTYLETLGQVFLGNE